MPNAVIGALRVNLGLDSAQFETGLKGASKSAQNFTKAFMIGIAALGAAAAGAFVAIQGQTRAMVDTLREAQTAGVDFEEFQGLRYAAERNQVAVEALTDGLKELNLRADEFVMTGGGPAAEAFARLGYSASELQGKLQDPSALFSEIIDKLRELDTAAQIRIADEIFGGTGGEQFVRLLDGGAEGLERLKEEARRLGLVVSEDTARAALTFQDNLGRLQAMAIGVANSLTAMALPALVAVTDALIGISGHVGEAIASLSNFSGAAAIAASALAGFFAPAVLSGLASVAVAIGTTMVGAVRALTAAMLANPLGLLIAGIAAAVTAIFLFRDEIKQVIGVDVVDVLKGVGNTIIGTFKGAFDAIGAVWGMLPSVLGDVAVSAANLVIKSIEDMINKVIGSLNNFFNDIALGLAAIGRPLSPEAYAGLIMSPVEFGRIPNENEGAAGDAADKISDSFSSALEVDYIGQLTAKIGEFTTSAEGASAAITDLGGSLDGNGTGGGAAGGAESLGSAADDTGNKLSKLADIGKQVGSTLANSFTDLFMSFIEGGKNALDIVADLLKSLARLMLNNVFQSLFGGLFGGEGGGILGGLFGGTPGFANGTRSAPGGLAWVGERGRELVNLPRGSQVIPNSKIDMGGSVIFAGDTIVTVQGSTGDPQQDAAYTDMVKRAVEQAVDRRIAENMRVGGLLKPRLS